MTRRNADCIPWHSGCVEQTSTHVNLEQTWKYIHVATVSLILVDVLRCYTSVFGVHVASDWRLMSYVVFVEIIMPTVYRDSFSRRGQIVVESISAYHGPNCYTILLARSTINARRCRVVSASDCGVRGSRVRITPRAVVFITTAAAHLYGKNEYQLTGWVIITVAMVNVADSQPKSTGLV